MFFPLRFLKKLKERVRSFTLIEVLISLSITSITLTLSYSLLFTMTTNFVKLSTEVFGHSGLNLVYKLLDRDLAKTIYIEKISKDRYNLFCTDGHLVYEFKLDPKRGGLLFFRRELINGKTNTFAFFLKRIWVVDIESMSTNKVKLFRVSFYDRNLDEVLEKKILGSWQLGL